MASRELKRQLVEAVRKATGVKFTYRLLSFMTYSGNVDTFTREISLRERKRDSLRFFASTLLHEINHIIAYRDKKFWAFHTNKSMDRMTKVELRAHIRTGFRAEKYIDRQAAKMMTKLFPHWKYVNEYKDSDKSWFNKNYMDDFRRKLKRKR